MIPISDLRGRPHGGRALGVVLVAVAVVLGCLVAALPRAMVASSLGADPSEPTVPVPTQAPATVAPTAPATQPAPTVAATDPSQEVPATSSQTTSWSRYPSSGGSGSQWQSSNSVVRSEPQTTWESGEVTTSSAPPMTTTQDLLIGPPTTQPSATTVPRHDVAASSVTRTGGSSDPKVWVVVAALGLVAVALGVATAWYWRRTRPLTVDGGADGDDGPRTRPRRRSRYADLVVTSPEPR